MTVTFASMHGRLRAERSGTALAHGSHPAGASSEERQGGDTCPSGSRQWGRAVSNVSSYGQISFETPILHPTFRGSAGTPAGGFPGLTCACVLARESCGAAGFCFASTSDPVLRMPGVSGNDPRFVGVPHLGFSTFLSCVSLPESLSLAWSCSCMALGGAALPKHPRWRSGRAHREASPEIPPRPRAGQGTGERS